MPWNSNNELPESVKNAIPSSDGRSLFRRVANSQLRGGKSDSVAMASAWAALKNAGYERTDEGWVKKVDISDVHTDKPLDDVSTVSKAEYQGREVELDKPFRTPGESKKFAVYVKDGDKVKIVRFGDPDMEIRRDDPEARANFRARHSCDTAKDKTSARYWSCRMWSGDSVSEITKDFTIDCNFTKVNEEQRLVYGFASVIEEDGKPVVDQQGDVITEDELVRAAHDYVMKSRAAKVMHKGAKRGELVESIVLTDDVKRILKSSLGTKGWLVGFKIEDDEVWERVKKGELGMFSIGGRGKRVEIKEEN